MELRKLPSLQQERATEFAVPHNVDYLVSVPSQHNPKHLYTEVNTIEFNETYSLSKSFQDSRLTVKCMKYVTLFRSALLLCQLTDL